MDDVPVQAQLAVRETQSQANIFQKKSPEKAMEPLEIKLEPPESNMEPLETKIDPLECELEPLSRECGSVVEETPVLYIKEEDTSSEGPIGQVREVKNEPEDEEIATDFMVEHDGPSLPPLPFIIGDFAGARTSSLNIEEEDEGTDEELPSNVSSTKVVPVPVHRGCRLKLPVPSCGSDTARQSTTGTTGEDDSEGSGAMVSVRKVS